jgi:hypothetical protein
MMSRKILLNGTVSEGAKFMSMDIKDFYLGTPMEQKEYMRIHLSQIPPPVQEEVPERGLGSRWVRAR